MSYFRVNERCNGCLACEQNCPASALDHRDEGEQRTLLHNMTKCARCATCWRVCPQEAIEFEHLLASGWDEVVSLQLVRCEVCGDPVHSVRLAEGLEAPLAELATPRCDHHRSRDAALARAGATLALRQRPGGSQ